MNKKYIVIYNELINNIKTGLLLPGTKLSSENELMQQYDVSRDTIRKALNLLESNGYIQKVKGKGSFILDINKFDFPVSGLTSFKELSERMGQRSVTFVEELDVIMSDEYLMQQLNLADEDEVWKVVRVREIGGKRIILDKEYFNKKIISILTKDICQDSIYQYIEKELGLNISFAKKEITVQKATQEDMNYLDLEDYDMIVVVKSHVYLEDATLFQYTESRHRPDKFRFVDFARRQH